MRRDKSDVNHAPDGITYNRQTYECANPDCGSWITAETPQDA